MSRWWCHDLEISLEASDRIIEEWGQEDWLQFPANYCEMLFGNVCKLTLKKISLLLFWHLPNRIIFVILNDQKRERLI